jgi:predicted TIM-barrel fold metal-dependent hydrolase
MRMMGERRLSFRCCLCCNNAAPLVRRRPPARRRVMAASTRSLPGNASAGTSVGRSATALPQDQTGTTPARAPHRIDIHHHIAPPAYVEEMKERLQPPTLAWTPARSLEDMDKAGVATSITSITTPGVWIGDDQQGRRLARDCNEYAARMVADYPGRFGMFAALPLPYVEASLREIEHGLDVLKADGIALFTSYRDKWLGDPAFEPVMEELNRREAVVYTHPEAPLCCRGILPGIHESVLEYGFDTTRAIARILFSGTAMRYPRIRWIFSHGGGTAPFLAERLVRAPGLNKSFAQYVPNGVMAELQRFYYDVAQVAHPLALSALTRLVPISQILWGTDYPFRFGWEYVKALGEFGFSADELRRIDRENALALLPRWRTS